jgi:hopanoid biosynthesis associated RND transporter like protein HpnN
LLLLMVRASARHALAVVCTAVLGMLAAGAYVGTHLGINTDTADMISQRLPWRQQYIDFQEQFPQFTDALVVVLDSHSVERSDAAAVALAQRLTGYPDRVSDVSLGRNDPFFLRNAFLYLTPAELEDLASRLVQAQPLLGRLAQAPGLVTLVDLLEASLHDGATQIRGDRAGAGRALDRFADALAATMDGVRAGTPRALAWQDLLRAPGAAAPRPRAVLLVQPRLDYSKLFPAEPVTLLVRELAEELRLAEQGVTMRITGGVAMADEELRSVSQGAAWAAALALALVTAVLVAGMGSLRLVLVALLTLLAGLSYTAAFAAAAVGELNMISLAFAVLYIGLGVDYAIHFALRYQEQRAGGVAHAEALERAAQGVGGPLALCALTTGVGFLAFVPTDFAGLSELGMIAGAGMAISFLATVLLLPALLTLMGPRACRTHPLDAALTGVIDRLSHRGGATVLVLAVLLAVAGVLLATQVRFDENPLNLRAEDGEALSTYRELVRDGGDWSLDALVSSLASAEALAEKVAALPEVATSSTLNALVPAAQRRKLVVVEDLALLLGLDMAPPTTAPGRVEPGVVERLADSLRRAALDTDVAPGRARLTRAAQDWTRWSAALDERTRNERLASLQQAAMSGFGPMMRRLQLALEASAVSATSLPERIRADWVAADGRYRVRIEAAGDLNDRSALVGFVEAVRSQVPTAVGEPIVILGAGAVAVDAFKQAFATALAAIIVILWWSSGRLRAVAGVVYPLLLGALMSAALMVCFDVPFNFANVIALPLLLGIGVDSAIHMRERARSVGPGGPGGVTAARAVVTSAATSLASFGNLSWSAHPGTASMGQVLVIGLLCVLFSTLVVLPVLVRWLEGGSRGVAP